MSQFNSRIPVGIVAFAASLSGPLARKIDPKWIMLLGQALCIIAMVLFTFADRPERYWSYTFPGFVLGSAGAMMTYTHTK